MIVQIFLNFFAALLAGMVSLIPSLSADQVTFLNSLPGKANTLLAPLGALSPIVPWDVAIAGVSTIGVWAAVCALIVIAQRLVSLAAMGGGTAP